MKVLIHVISPTEFYEKRFVDETHFCSLHYFQKKANTLLGFGWIGLMRGRLAMRQYWWGIEELVLVGVEHYEHYRTHTFSSFS